MLIRIITKLYFWKCNFFTKNSFNQEMILGTHVLSEYEWKRDIIINRVSLNKKWSRRKLYRHNPKIIENKIEKPEISVLISLYKSEKFLRGFIQNILEQSHFGKAEFIFVAVEPTDKELKILKEFCSVNSNCILIRSEDRISIYEAWNQAIDRSTANLLTNMNVDDLRSPSSLETQVNFMNKNENVDVGYQDILFYRDLKSNWNYVKNYNFKTELPEVSVPCLAWLGINPPHNAPVWRKNLHTLYGQFDSSLVSAGDYEFWLRICIEGVRFKKMKETHVGYFVNPAGMSTKSDSQSSKEEKIIQEAYKDRFMKIMEIPENICENQHFEQLCDFLGEGNLKEYYREINK